MKNFLASILVVLSVLGFNVYQQIGKEFLEPVNLVVTGQGSIPSIQYETIKEEQLGTITFRPSEFKTSLAQGKTQGHSDTTLVVNSITTKDDNTLDPLILGDRIVLHISPGRSNAEIVVCTGLTTGTRTFTGCTFGYRFDRDATSSTLILAHSPGETIIISDDDHYLSVQYPRIDARNVFTGDNWMATTTDTIVKLYFGNAATDTDTYIWHNRSTGAFGFATSSSGELAWNTTGTTFTPIIPITLTSGELKLATSSYDFVLDGNNLRIATSTVSSGTASGQRLDNYWNLRWNATTTHEGGFTFRGAATSTAAFWVGSGGTANNLDLTGGDGYFQGDVEIDGGIFLSDTADIYRMATTTDLATSTDEQVGYVTLWTYSVPANIIGAHGILRLTFVGNCNVSSNGGCSIRVTYGGSTVCDGGGANLFIGGATVDYRVICSFANGASTSAQYGVEGLLTSTSTHTFIPSNTSIDSSVAQNLLIRAIGTGGSATINLNQVYVEFLK